MKLTIILRFHISPFREINLDEADAEIWQGVMPCTNSHVCEGVDGYFGARRRVRPWHGEDGVKFNTIYCLLQSRTDFEDNFDGDTQYLSRPREEGWKFLCGVRGAIRTPTGYFQGQTGHRTAEWVLWLADTTTSSSNTNLEHFELLQDMTDDAPWRGFVRVRESSPPRLRTERLTQTTDATPWAEVYLTGDRGCDTQTLRIWIVQY